MKKLVALALSLMIIFALAVCPLTASAIVTSYSGTLTVLPGNTRSSSPEYNYAWLDNLVVRDDAMAVTSKTITPKPTDHPGSHTYDEFIIEAEQYTTLFELNENTVVAAYNEITQAMYYLIVAMNMTDGLDEMRDYIASYGIRLPANEDIEDKTAIAVIYATLKYDAIYALYEKEVEIPQGTSLDGAMVIILSALTNTTLPSGIDTLTGMAVNTMKQYVTQFDELPISMNPSPEEVFHWAKVVTAALNDYQVPLTVFDEATTAQKEYVDYAYYASIINTVYDVTINPINLMVATQSEDELAVQKLIMQTMLQEKGVDFDYGMSAEKLFALAEANGCFALEDELYSDVLNYEIVVAETTEKIWFTPYPLAEQLEGGSNEFLTIKLNDKKVEPNSTTSLDLYTSLKEEKILLSVNYDDGTRNDTAVYEFRIIKDASLNDENTVQSENNLVAEIEKFVNTIVPDKDSEAGQKIDSVFAAIDDKVQENIETAPQAVEGLLTTYGVEENTTYAVTTEGTSGETTERFDFEYLEELIGDVYATDENGNIVTKATISGTTQPEQSDENVFEKAAETVKENPEIVVAPTGIITLGSLAGYFLSKRHRDTLPEDIEEETEE